MEGREDFERFRDGVIKAYLHSSYKGYTNNPEKVDMPSHNDWYEAGVAYVSMCISAGDYPVFEELSESEKKEAMQSWTND